MNDNEVTLLLLAAKDALLALHASEQKRLRRKPHAAELVDAAKAWAQRLIDATSVYPGPKRNVASFSSMMQRASIFAGDKRKQYFAPEVTAAELLLAIIDHIREPMMIVVAFKNAFPVEFAGVRYLPTFVRVVQRSNGDYSFYRRQETVPPWEVRLPDDPTSDEFMVAYRKAERAYANFAKPRKSYHREGPQALAA